jgi:superfamily II DNA or RNA helicase
VLRKNSPYFEVNKLNLELIRKLSQIAEVISAPQESGVTKFKLDLSKAANRPLSELVVLFKEAGYHLAASTQKVILQAQGISLFAELFLRESDLILKPKGFLELDGVRDILTYNSQERTFHTLPMNYQTLLHFLINRGYNVVSHVQEQHVLSEKLQSELKLELILRDYQEEALHRWFGSKNRGVIVLPTGAGKTLVALEAIRRLKSTTLIVVPTLDLLNQWREALQQHLNVPEVGVLGGGSKVISDITVSTYDSASLLSAKISTNFGLLIFDEAHHLPSPSYRLAAESSIAPYRLGLTATPERYDELHVDLEQLVGPIVYRIAPRLLEQEGYLAQYRIQTIQVTLSPEEKLQYEAHMKIFRNYTKKLSEIIPSWNFETIVTRTLFDPEARRALSFLEKARRIALEASMKINYIGSLLEEHRDEKIIIFSRYTRIVERISDLFGIPLITHKTKVSEREQILSGFRDGTFSKIVTGQVLDEGVDVPDASVGIIISGTGSKREFIQRLGRLLRPKKKEALLIELVTESTIEDGLARRRRDEENV